MTFFLSGTTLQVRFKSLQPQLAQECIPTPPRHCEAKAIPRSRVIDRRFIVIFGLFAGGLICDRSLSQLCLKVHLDSADKQVRRAEALVLVVQHGMNPVELDFGVGIQEPSHT